MPEVVTAPAVTSGGKLRNNNIETCLLLQPHQGTDQENVNTRFWLTPTQTQDCCVAGWISAVPICTASSFLSFTQRSAQTPAP